MKSNKKKIITIIIVISLILVAGVTIYFINVSYSGQSEQNNKNCIVTSLGDDNLGEIELIGSQRLTDEQGLKLEPMNFTITSNCPTQKEITFDVELSRVTNITSSRVKVALNNNVYLLTSLPISTNKNYGENIYTVETVNIEPGQTIEYSYRNWENLESVTTNTAERIVATNIIIRY